MTEYNYERLVADFSDESAKGSIGLSDLGSPLFIWFYPALPFACCRASSATGQMQCHIVFSAMY